jgi:Mn2+/Fe2+ NRAMP family transporter
VEEEIAQGRTTLVERIGATRQELSESRRDVALGMFFSNVVMYFIILSTASTLYRTGKTQIDSAAEAAQALQPLAGSAAALLFALGIVAVGFLAIPVMTTGAAYDLSQTLGWRSSLHARPKEAPKFYSIIVAFSVLAMALNFMHFNPMKALVWAGIVQGFSTPPLMLVILLMTNNPAIMGNRANTRPMKVLGWITVAITFAATLGLLATWLM